MALWWDLGITMRQPRPFYRSKDEPVTASKFKWATSLDNQFKFDFKTATPKEDITEIDWVRLPHFAALTPCFMESQKRHQSKERRLPMECYREQNAAISFC